jgi:signal transduction histidine kinase/ActR/RegA family two-component response regulator
VPANVLTPEIEELAGIGTWMWDVAQDTMSWSAQVYRIFDISPGTPLTPAEMPGLRPESGEGLVATTLRQALRHGTPWRMVHPAVTASGRPIWLRSSGRVERTDGRTVRMLGILQDVTEEQAAKVELERNKVLLEEISALSGTGGWEFDVAANRVLWSRETRRIYEVGDAFEPTAESLKPLFSPGSLEIQDACIQRAIATSAPAVCELDALTLSGRPIRVKSTCRVEHTDQAITRIIGTVQDITRQHATEQTLDRTKRILKDIASLTGVGGWEVSLPSGEMFWTSQVRRIFEVDNDFAPTNESMAQFIPPDELVRVQEAVSDAAQNGSGFDLEFNASTATGREVRLRSVGHRQTLNGKPTRVIGTLEDVTARRKAEADRSRHEALNEQVSRLSRIGGWQFDVRTKETIWSPEVRRIYEVAEDYNPPLGDHPKFVAPEFQDIVTQARRQGLVHGLPVELEFQAITATGRRIWVRNIYQAERVDGRTVRFFGTAQDVTEQRVVQERMDALHARLTASIEAAELRVWEIDLDSGILTWAQDAPPALAAAATGGDLDAQAALALLHPDDQVKFEKTVHEVHASGQPSVLRVRVRAPDNVFRRIEMRLRPSISAAGRRKVLGVSRDVTRDVALNDELDRKRREAEASSLAKSQFVARMSHEIRTPMSGVIGMLEVLLRAEVDPVKKSHAATALKSARDLMSVLDDIIDVSQLESRHLALDIVAFSLRSVVDDVVTLFGTLAGEKSLVLSSDIDLSVPDWVKGDPRRVRQVLTNLVGNAIKFTPAGKVEIALRYSPVTGTALFSVRDTGEGIPESSIGSVFEQFFQANSAATRRHGGSGLGLAISRQLVGMMEGEIQVESEVGVGSTFTFTIHAPLTGPPSRTNGEPDATPARSLRVLVAEDNLPMQRILCALLEAGGHEMTVVSDGRAAVAAAASGTYDVILMDVMMPVMDGPTATQQIRDLGGRAGGVPIIALTANALVGDRDRYLQVGMTDYLSKPINVAALFAALARVTRGSEGPPGRP